MVISALIETKNKFLIYFSTCLFGLFLSNTTPSSFSLAEIYIGMTRKCSIILLVYLTKIMSFFIASLTSFVILNAAIGEIVLPLIVGSLFEKAGAISFLIVELLATVLALIIFLKFWQYCRQNSQNFGKYAI